MMITEKWKKKKPADISGQIPRNIFSSSQKPKGCATTLTTTGHPVHHSLRTHGEMYSFEVTIKDNVWIGSNVVICPGVTIGENSVIGAGSIVLRDVPANCVAAGNPCRVLREITDRDLEYYYKDLRVADQLDL